MVMQRGRVGGFRLWGQRVPSMIKPAVVAIELQQASGYLQALTLTDMGLDCSQVSSSFTKLFRMLPLYMIKFIV